MFQRMQAHSFGLELCGISFIEVKGFGYQIAILLKSSFLLGLTVMLKLREFHLTKEAYLWIYEVQLVIQSLS